MAYRGGGRGEQQPQYGDPGCSAAGEGGGGGGGALAPYRPTGFVWPLRMPGRPQQHEPPPPPPVDVVYYGARAAIPAPHEAAYVSGGAVLWRSAPLMEESTLAPPAAAGGEAVASDIDPVRPGRGAPTGKKVMIEENEYLFCDFHPRNQIPYLNQSIAGAGAVKPDDPKDAGDEGIRDVGAEDTGTGDAAQGSASLDEWMRLSASSSQGTPLSSSIKTII